MERQIEGNWVQNRDVIVKRREKKTDDDDECNLA